MNKTKPKIKDVEVDGNTVRFISNEGKRRTGMAEEASDNLKEEFIGSLVLLMYVSPMVFGVLTLATLFMFENIALACIMFVCAVLSRCFVISFKGVHEKAFRTKFRQRNRYFCSKRCVERYMEKQVKRQLPKGFKLSGKTLKKPTRQYISEFLEQVFVITK